MTSNCEPLGKCIRIPYLTDPDPEEMRSNLKYTQMLLKKAEKEEAEKAKAVLDEVAKMVREESKLEVEPIAEKKKYKPREVLEYKSFPEIAPKLFEELIERNKSDYLKLIKEKIYPFIERKLEWEVSAFIYDRTLAFNKTIEKIKYDEFLYGARSKTGRIITQPIEYRLSSICEGIKMAKKRKTFFTYRFNKGDYQWFFLNTSENQVLLERIEAGRITEKDLFIMNEQKVNELRKKKEKKKNPNTTHPENHSTTHPENVGVTPPENVEEGSRNCTALIQKMNDTHPDNLPQTIENTNSSETPIITINNNYKKNNQQIISAKNVDASSLNYFSEKQEEYIKKLCNVQTPQGENIRFTLNQAREIVKLDLGRSIFDIIDEKIEMLFLEKNSKGGGWAGILSNMIKGDRGGPEAYNEFKKNREGLLIHEKYILLIRIFEPDARSSLLDRNRAINFIQDRIETLYQIAIKNKNLEARDELIYKIQELEKACDLEKDLDFHINDPASILYQMIQEIKNLK